MSDNDLLSLTHAYREDALTDADAVRLGQALTDDPAARRALALDGQIALALGDDRTADEALLATLRAHWPVRSPSSARQTRPHTGTVRGRRTTAPRWIAAAGVLIAVVLVATVWWRNALPAPTLAPVLSVAPLTIGSDHPTVRRGGVAEALTATRPLHHGDRLSVPSGATVALSGRQEPTVLHLSGPAELTLQRDTPGKHLVLHHGRISATVAPQPAGHPLVISCPFSEVTVVGTTFSIAADETGDRIEVRHGTVRVAAADSSDSVLVASGDSAEAGPGRPLVLRTATAPATVVTPAATHSRPDSWFDFTTVTGTSVADRLAGRPGTLIDATVGSDGRGGSALHLDGGNSRFVFPVPAVRDLTIAFDLRRERQPAGDPNPTLIALPNLVLYTNLGQDPPARTDHSLHLITRSGPPISGWSTNGQLLRHGEWQRLVLIVRTTDGGVVPDVWVDGVHQQLWPWKGDWPQARPDPHHGMLGIEPGVQYSIAGLVKDLRLWPHALSASEITALAAAP